MSDDGWGIGNPVDKIVEAYECIEADVEKNPVEREVKEPEDPSKKIPIISTVKEDHVFYLPDTDDDDDHYVSRPGRKKQFFKPPLQVQRNHYVKNTIKNFVNNRNFVFKKLAVLGCGESSLEKFFCHDLSGIGFERVISVDIDEAALATGIRLLRHSLKMHECHIKQSSRLPVLFEHYLGSILEYDERLAGVDCVCSTEVIEHIPLEDAEKYARLVLDQIRPKLFILSTPNHEYNKAFGMEPGQFRHGDHKYEFTRIEFIDWVKKLLAETSPGYKYEMHYVGNTPDFHELQGATQFALFYRDGEVKEKPFAPVRNYQKVAASIAYEGLYTILAARGRLGLKTWLQRNTLDKTNLKVTEYAKFWEIPLDEIIVLMGISLYILADISRQKLLDMLKAVSRGKVFSTYGGDEANDSEHFIVVPGDCRPDILIDSL